MWKFGFSATLPIAFARSLSTMVDVASSFSMALLSDSCQGMQKLAKQLIQHVSKHPDQSSRIPARVLRTCLAPDDAVSVPKVAAFLGQIIAAAPLLPCTTPATVAGAAPSSLGSLTEDLVADLCGLCDHRSPCVRIRALGFLCSVLRAIPPSTAVVGEDSAQGLLEVLTQVNIHLDYDAMLPTDYGAFSKQCCKMNNGLIFVSLLSHPIAHR